MGDAAVHREIERKLEVDDDWTVPELPRAVGCARALRPLVLTAVYYDTDDLRLARHRITLRRRTGGVDDGWHLKLPAGGEHERDEVHLPLHTAGDPPLAFVWLVLGFTRGAPLSPVATLVNQRRPITVTDAHGRALAEITDDHVTVEREGSPVTRFREVEVEAAQGRTDADLDALMRFLVASGARPGSFASKAVRALGAAAQGPPDVGRLDGPALRRQTLAVQQADLALRRELPDAVERFAAALADLRDTLRTSHPALWRESGGVTEVLSRATGTEGRAELQALLREPRYVALLDALVATARDDE